MALTKIGVGTTANDGTGDPIRTAFQKVNTAFDVIDLASNNGAVDSILQRIKRAVNNVPAVRRNQSKPIIAASAWVLSTAYLVGQRVTNGGNVYVCAVAGTSAGSGGPLTTVFALIADNTASWYWIGAAITSDSDAPTVSASTTAPTTGRAYMNAASAVTQTGLTLIKNDSWYDQWGTTTGTMASGILGATNDGNASSGISFIVDGDTLILRADVSAGGYISIEVDGRYLHDGPYYYSTTGSAVYLTIAFPTRRQRRIALRWNGSLSSYTLKAVIVDTKGMIFPPDKRSGNIRGAYMGDSYSLSTNGGDLVEKGLAANLFAELGIEQFYINGTGGTGFFAGGANFYQSTTRIAKIVASAPDVVVVQGSLNDNGTSQANMQAAVSSVISQLRAGLPNAWIIVTGSLSQASAESTTDSYIRLQLVAIADPKVIFVPGTGDTAGPYITGTGSVAAPGSNGNSDVYYGSDVTHPVARGYVYIGQRLGAAVRNAFLTMLG